jgi:hypothetical protein
MIDIDDPRLTALTIPLDATVVRAPNKFHLGMVWAYMVFPDDPAMRRRSLALAAAEYAADRMEAGLLSREKTKRLVRQAIEVISPEDLQEKSAARILKGASSGLTVYNACPRASRAPTRKSPVMKNIMREITAVLSTQVGENNDSRKMYDDAWNYKHFRSVAHFWAAYLLLEEVDELKDDVPCSLGSLPHFLSLSENFLQLAASTKHAAGTVLQKDKCFRLSDDIATLLPAGSLFVTNGSTVAE